MSSEPDAALPEGVPEHDLSWQLGQGPLAERQQIRQTQDTLGEARCPRCHALLVARQGRHGPYFHCLCVERQRTQKSAAPRRCA